MNKKCKHGKEFCCKCKYGELSHIDLREKYYDLVHDIGKAHNGIWRRLKRGYEMLRGGVQ